MEKETSTRKMTVTEAMKRLRIIEKRMQANCVSISTYSSSVSTEKPLFETETIQKKEVAGLIQANGDLLNEYLYLKKRVEETNLRTTVEIGGVSYIISDLLVIKRKLAQTMVRTYRALNDEQGERRKSSTGIGPDGASPHVVRFYDEKVKNEGLRKWQDLLDNIESRLETINALTDLVE